MKKAVQSRFWRKVEKGNDSQCWLWTAHKVGHMKYGRIRIDSEKRILAHRASWKIYYGKIPKGLHVLHKCDNPACVNPNHLFLGSDKDNYHDARAKGRRPAFKGTGDTDLNLIAPIIIKIRNDRRFQREIAKEYNMDQSTISMIKSRKLWGHI